MSIRTFWIILLRLFGLWLVYTALLNLLTFFITIAIPYLNYGNDAGDYMSMLIWIISGIGLALALIFIILRVFVFRPTWLIDKLKLDKGFPEEKLDLIADTQTLLRLAIVIFGALLIIDALPALLNNLYVAFVNRISHESVEFKWIVTEGIKTVIGYLLMTNSKPVATFIEKQRTKGNDTGNQ